ncbi:D-alanyl-D-alanine carboxypeptidase/D-alanyl-D-alanine-endopeptidase [bacterium]|nr:D-alanyl-D-alanine carboxypeptidase/D-alanyl-D-alanine-endopeptidase [bacterium]
MKNVFKTLIIIMVVVFGINASYALSSFKLDKHIKKSDLDNKATIAVSVRNVENNNVVYEYNQNKLLHPASTLKIFTTYAAIDTLGYDYHFKTKFYKDSENNLYIKTGADPMLTSSQLKLAINKLKEDGKTSFKNLYIDDSIIDKKEFAPGWMWDDDINPYTPKVSSYNLDGNVVKVNMTKSSNGMMSTSLKSTYPMSVVSNIKSGSKTNYIDVNRYNWSNPEVVEIYGSVNEPQTIIVPISSMRRYYIHSLEKALEDNRITITGTSFSSKLVPNNAELLTEIDNSIKDVIPKILQNSNNLMAESIFKLSGAVKYSATGTNDLAVYAFKEFYKNNDIETDDIIIKDGSGVSRNNLFTADWMTNALDKLYKQKDFETFKENMAQAGDGTLLNRLHDLRGEVWLKTGSLSNVSSLAGYVKSQDGHTYSVAIMIQNFNDSQTQIKSFENEIIQIIYNK